MSTHVRALSFRIMGPARLWTYGGKIIGTHLNENEYLYILNTFKFSTLLINIILKEQIQVFLSIFSRNSKEKFFFITL